MLKHQKEDVDMENTFDEKPFYKWLENKYKDETCFVLWKGRSLADVLGSYFECDLETLTGQFKGEILEAYRYTWQSFIKTRINEYGRN